MPMQFLQSRLQFPAKDLIQSYLCYHSPTAKDAFLLLEGESNTTKKVVEAVASHFQNRSVLVGDVFEEMEHVLADLDLFDDAETDEEMFVYYLAQAVIDSVSGKDHFFF